ncbi:TMV resistance protein N [Morella rubra]|uniref:TMV resistance protein N n=1 Tax=Morella rubra TaxID=262757 RepID=A0A6A1UQK3_9ROSI|nr:TMV resistance protein N [Morella rubra]
MQHTMGLAKSFARRILGSHHQFHTISRPCDVFINHRGIDTKKQISGLLHDRLSGMGLTPFLDCRSMKPGDKLFDKIDAAIRDCKVGVAVFSPRYCDSYFCLYELALLVESKKRVVPIFCDVKPSQLRLEDNGTCPEKELQRFGRALEEAAKNTVGLTFDSLRGDWSEFLMSASDAIAKNLLEVDEERLGKSLIPPMFQHSSFLIADKVNREIARC